MKRLEIYRQLRKHANLAEERNPAMQDNKIAKGLGYFMAAFILIYLIIGGTALGTISNSASNYYGTEFLCIIMPMFLMIDFFFRFIIQQTPSQTVKPYLLLPISRMSCIEYFLLRITFNGGNFIWMALFIPYTIIAVLFIEGFWTSILFLLAMELTILINSQWYLFVRTLLQKSIFWWILPIVVYGLMLVPIIFDIPFISDDDIIECLAFYGYQASSGNILVWLCGLSVFAIYLLINRKFQYHMVYNEVLGQEKVVEVKQRDFKFIQKLGETGQYLKLEILMIQRCKNLRKTFITANVFVILIPLLLSFSEIYDGFLISRFWLVYCFDCYGAMILVKVMCYEGNYIDLLMVHREKLISLLRAKYIFYSALTIIPLICMIPVCIVGKMSFFLVISMAIFTAGLQNALFMILVPVNRQTMPLHTKLTGKGGMESNYLQLIAEMVTFGVPLLLISVVSTFFNEWVCAIILSAIGIGVFYSQNWWLRKIYNAFIKVKYRNLESLRATAE